MSFVEHPPLGSILRAIVVPPYGGDTVWANTVAGYEDLPAELRTLADTLWAVHTNDFDYQVANAGAGVDPDSLEEFQDEFASTVFKTLHPVVQVHPETGERAFLLGSVRQGDRGALVGRLAAAARDLPGVDHQAGEHRAVALVAG